MLTHKIRRVVGMGRNYNRQMILHTALVAAGLSAGVASAPAQSPTSNTPVPSEAPAQPGQKPDRVVLPDVTVVAQKEPANAQKLPISVTAITADMLARAGVTIISDAAIAAPNVIFTEFTARKLSNARFRSVGSSPANPAITTFIDGVPQLNANTSSVELLDVDQIEFVRGPQSALFGRNTLGGLVNVASARPSLSAWTGHVVAPFGNFDSRGVRAAISGPLASTVGLSLAIGHAERDGFTTNSITGNVIDDRKATYGKAQLLWTPASNWETRLILSGERSRDGDYALNDLAAERATPFTVARDFEGNQDRDVKAGTFIARRAGSRYSFTSTTGLVRWKTVDVTDLDYSPLPFLMRDNTEEATQFTQEFRIAAAPVTLSDAAALTWQLGVFGFTQDYEQDAINTIGAMLPPFFAPFPIRMHTPKGTIDDFGLAAFGHATLTLNSKFDIGVGARADRERKTAELSTFFDPSVAPAGTVDAERKWTNVSPSASLGYRINDSHMIYASGSRGFKAGGFNPAAPPSATIYDEELSWNAEGGLKTTWAGGKVRLNGAVFYIDWTDLQLNLPIPGGGGQFYISNVGGATSRGLELELTARATDGVDLFGSFGYTRARFSEGSVSTGADVSDKKVPFTPDYTASFGLQVSRNVRSNVMAFGRAEVVARGEFQYDDANTAGQEAYALVNLRAGVEVRRVTVEGWMRNAFDKRYIPTAFSYPGLAPSGFVGESGAPRTFGISVGVRF
jgi:iron complex outermembrane receptor protein